MSDIAYMANESALEVVGQMIVTSTLRECSKCPVSETYFSQLARCDLSENSLKKYYFKTEYWDPPKQTRLFLRSFPLDQESTHQSE